MKDSPYFKRLRKDFEELEKLKNKSNLIDFEKFGDPPNRYIIKYKCKGIIKDKNNLYYSEYHEVEIRLGSTYPTTPPDRKFITKPIFHPNVSDINGNICIGNWTPSLKLYEWVINIGEMIQYKRYNIHDVLNPEAAKWCLNNENILPIDDRDLILSSGPINIKGEKIIDTFKIRIKGIDDKNDQN